MKSEIKIFVTFITFSFFCLIYSVIEESWLRWFCIISGIFVLITLFQFMFSNIRFFNDSSIKSIFKSARISFVKSKNKSHNLS